MTIEDEVYRIGTWREYAKEISWAGERYFTLELATTALIVVDMTEYQCSPDAPFGIARTLRHDGGKMADYYFRIMESTVPAIRNLLDFFRQNCLRVIFLTQGPYSKDGLEVPYHLRMSHDHMVDTGEPDATGSPQFEIISELQPETNELVFHKVTNSGFAGTSLNLVLRNLGVTTLVYTGAATDGCVEATARDGADLGYKTVVVEDACVTQSQLFHEVVLMHCIQMWGRVLNSNQVVAELAERV